MYEKCYRKHMFIDLLELSSFLKLSNFWKLVVCVNNIVLNVG